MSRLTFCPCAGVDILLLRGCRCVCALHALPPLGRCCVCARIAPPFLGRRQQCLALGVLCRLREQPFLDVGSGEPVGAGVGGEAYVERLEIGPPRMLHSACDMGSAGAKLSRGTVACRVCVSGSERGSPSHPFCPAGGGSSGHTDSGTRTLLPMRSALDGLHLEAGAILWPSNLRVLGRAVVWVSRAAIEAVPLRNQSLYVITGGLRVGGCYNSSCALRGGLDHASQSFVNRARTGIVHHFQIQRHCRPPEHIKRTKIRKSALIVAPTAHGNLPSGVTLFE